MADKKVLIVEDDEELHVLYTLYLQGESFHILKAFNGQQALEILEQEIPEVIVLDMIMPIMDGETFLLKLHERGHLKKIPVIIASVNDRIPQKLLHLGNVHAVLRKPFSIENLVGKIREAIAKKPA
ncbi:MAG: response regulator [Candidatus Omnitrophica bacterium]|nr:response regulator [Candidatus Omnitrophota bacterium]MDD5671427.1 response regulator [Candidatus Omnitrophota bacterium]